MKSESQISKTIHIMNNLRLFICIVLLFCAASLPTTAFSEDKITTPTISTKNRSKKNYNILIIDSFHQGHFRNDIYTQQLLKMLNNSEMPIEAHIIRLDAHRIPLPAYWSDRLRIFLEQYKSGFFDLVIAIDDPALQTIESSNANELLGGAPLINLGTSIISNGFYPNAVDISDQYYLKENIDLIFKIFPETENVAFISSDSNFNKKRLSLIKEYVNQSTNISAIYFNQDKLSVDRILQKLDNLPKKTVVFIETLHNSEKDIEYSNLSRLFRQIAQASPFPVFSNSELAIKSGALGGVVQDIKPILNRVNSIASSILIKDKDIKILPKYSINTYTTMLNWDAMMSHNSNYRDLPDNTVYINRPHNSFGIPSKNSHILNILYRERPPLIFNDKAGNVHGVLAKLWKLWSEKSNIPINFKNINSLNTAEEDQLYKQANHTVTVGRSRILTNNQQDKGYKFLISTASIYKPNNAASISDWSNLSNKRIALVNNKSFKSFLEDKIPDALLISYKDSKSLFNDIDTNKFDFFFMEDIVAKYLLKEQGISNNFSRNTFCSSKITFGTHFNPELQTEKAIATLNKTINSGMKKLSFKTIYELFSPFLNKDIISYPVFTPAEKQYLAEKSSFTTNTLTQWEGMEHWQDNTTSGAIPDIMRLIIARTNSYLAFKNSNLHANKVNLLLDDNIDFLDFAADSTQKNLLYTLPYLKLSAIAVTKNKDVYLNNTNVVIAVPSTYITYYYYLKKKFPHNTIILTKSAIDAVEMVNNNIGDIAMLGSISASRILDKPKYKNMHSNMLSNFKLNFAISMLDTKENKILLEILNKIIVTIPQNKISEIVAQHTYIDNNKLTLDMLLSIIIPSIIVLAIILLLLWGYTTRRALKKLNQSEEALRKEKSWLNATMHSIGEGMIATDVAGTIMQMNSVAEELLNVKENDVIGHYTNNLFTLYNSTSGEDFPDPIQTVLQSNRALNLQQDITLINNYYHEIPINATATPIKEPDNDNLIGVVLIFKDIRAEAIYKRQLSQTKTLLSNAISLAGVTYFTYDIKHNKILVSSGNEESCLYITEKTFNLKDIFLNVVESDMETISDNWQELMDKKTHRFTLNYKVYNNNQIRYKRADILSEKDSRGDLARIFGVRIDVTNAIESEKEKQIANEKIEQAYNLAKLAYLEYFPGTQKLSCDEKVGDMFMLDNSITDNLSFDELFINVSFQDKNKFNNFFKSSTNTYIDNYEQELQISKENNTKTLKIFISNTYDQANNWIHSNGAVLDITELYYIQNELKASEEQKRIILGSIKESVAYLNNEHKVIWVNEATRDMFECDPEEIIGKTCNEVFCTDKDTCENCQNSPRNNMYENAYVESMTYKNKELLASTNIIRDKDNTITHFVKTFSDISKMKEIENNLKEAYQRAETANKAKSTFLSTMTHEIRTPLNAIIGFSALLQYEELDNNSGSYAQSINNAAKGLLSLVNNVLDFSRLEAKKLTLNTNTTIINDLLKDMISLFSTKAKSKKIALNFKNAESIPPLILDSDRLRQVLINIIGNAVKFTNKGSVTIETAVRELSENEQTEYELIISVTDTGIGIRQSEHSKIFHSFEQVESNSNRKYQGSGLGLSISKSLVELMNGEILLSSIPNQGSKFTIILHNLKAGKQVGEQTENNLKELVIFQPAKILVVISRQHQELNITDDVLKKLNLTYTNVNSVDEAIERISTDEYNIVINALTRTEEDANTLPARIRANPLYENIPILAIASYPIPEDNFDISLYNEIMVIPITLEGFTTILAKYLPKKEKHKTRTFLRHEETELIVSEEIKNAVYEKFKDKFKSLQHGVILEEAEKIAKEFIGFSEKIGDNNLIAIAKKLEHCIATFKLPDIMKTIKLFLPNRDNDDK